MGKGGEPGHSHPERTKRSGHTYFFYEKHHGNGAPGASVWIHSLSEPQEFGIFNQADEFELADDRGNLYGLWIGEGGEIKILGTAGQLVAKFPVADPGQPWHGFPLWPLKKEGRNDRNRNEEQLRKERPFPKEILIKMEAKGMLTPSQRKRLPRGKRLNHGGTT